MIVLHAGFHEKRLYLWAETQKELPVSRGKSPRLKKKKPDLPPYAFGAPVETLQENIATLLPAALDHVVLPELSVWLPTVDDQPIPSSPLVAPYPEDFAAAKLQPWGITAASLGGWEIVSLFLPWLAAVPNLPGIVIGDDCRFWLEATRLAMGLVVRQQYLPSCVPAPGGKEVASVWSPVYSGRSLDDLSALARNMPPIARALAESSAAQPPSRPALSVLKDFVGVVVDSSVRAGGVKDSRPRANNIHDRWLGSLQSMDPVFSPADKKSGAFCQALAKWLRPVSLIDSAPWRLCFRLEEPGSKGHGADLADSWYVRFILQNVKDPSLLVPVADAWKMQGTYRKVLGSASLDIHEYLLMALGQAAALCPRLEAGLKESQPAGYVLDGVGAHEFLTEKSLALEASGFGVMLPAWWTRRGPKKRLGVRAKVSSGQSGANFALGDVAEIKWEMALGDEKISLAELQSLAKLKVPLVQWRGQWIEVNSAEIKAALAFWKKKGKTELTVRDLLKMALHGGEVAGDLPFLGVSADGWVKELFDSLAGGGLAFSELGAPEQFQGTLRPYQVRGYSWLHFLKKWGLGACLADDMGLGKTVQTLALIQQAWEDGERRPVLLVCPTSVVTNWLKEAQRFTPNLPVAVHHGGQRSRGQKFATTVKKQALVLSSYGLLHRDAELLQGIKWAGVILDEAQNIKNAGTKQAQAARTIGADYRIALSGTPVENNLMDLWSIMEFLNPGFLGAQNSFREKFVLPVQVFRDAEATTRLKKITAPFVLRRLKTDKTIIADLPDKIETKVYCQLNKEQASLYAAVLKEDEDSALAAKGVERQGRILAMIMKLKQICNHPRQFLGDNSVIAGRSGKLARFEEMLEEIVAVGDKALLFTQFAEMGRILQEHLQTLLNREVLFLHGGVSRMGRDALVERFHSQAGSELPVFILSLKAGGTGLNLTGANHVFHFDRWWNPAVENQATDRAYRIGQKKNVAVHKFVCAGTFEEKIDALIDKKQALAAEVVGTGESWLGKLSNDELRDILALRKEALEQE